MTSDTGFGTGGAGDGTDVKAEMRAAAEFLSRAGTRETGSTSHRSSRTSDLSIDEELTLHSVGWEPLQLVCGVCRYSVPMGVWNWGQGEITSASVAYARAFASATDRLLDECTKAGGRGVVGTHVDVVVQPHHVDVALVGTAVRAVDTPLSADPIFVSDLSGRDFALLHASGWSPVGLAAGASFVYAPRRTAGVALKQKSQNVELTNFTEAMYAARESAVERMQQSALAMGGSGVVEVKVEEGPMSFAGHAVGFTAYGTVVIPVAEHRRLEPLMVVALDDPASDFDPSSLRGG